MLLLALSVATSVSASVSINGTRVVYNEDQNEQTISLENKDDMPVLVQAWADERAGSRPARDADSPFLVTPSVFRLDPGQRQTLRILRIRQIPETHEESLYWLNIKEVPPVSKQQTNLLQLGILTRLKLFYRPADLEVSATEAISRLQWRVTHRNGQTLLECTNPSDAHVSLVSASWQQDPTGADVSLDMVAPHGHASWPISQADARHTSLWYQAVNDYGAVVVRQATLAHD
ncbi:MULTISPECIES: molecular chaperone [unclassified Halomonas]|uniref:fimbrial biogenesis chaperone n=1 Tax=Halomonas TaxID=2745 RepID=UPI001C97297D|nr:MULTISPECIES: molecular chaperone [unclassified Halomonas]MBY5924133.1 molecular chaperone [Halomonas sp. DP4Y7-2]MBY5982664.1 molecular chaperone [Halomonas sp. DP5Y7-2]MBY6231175.1 molecular chaperone [Halomonas sp. DP4Y7-1]